MTPRVMMGHIRQLCKYAGGHVEIGSELAMELGERSNACCDHDTRTIHLRNACQSEAMYASALHEVGHLYGRPPDPMDFMMADILGFCSQRLIAEERKAWVWAQDHALMWTDEMEARKRMCLKTYEQGQLGDE